MLNSEFIEWVAYFSNQDKRFTKEDWYSAQVAYILAKANFKGNHQFRDFVLQKQKPMKIKKENILPLFVSVFGGKVKKENG